MAFKVNQKLASNLWNKIFIEKINPVRSKLVTENIKKLNKKPIVIGGCGRSGTTLLSSLLGSNEEIFSINSETALLCPGCYGEAQIPLELNKIEKSLRIDKNKFFNICLNINLNNEKRWCEMTPRNIYYFEKIFDLFNGEVELVEIVRDGRDVILSKHSSDKNNYWVNHERWITEVEIGRKLKKKLNHHIIKYEDLVKDHKKTIGDLAKKLNTETSFDWENWMEKTNLNNDFAFGGKVKPIFNSSVGKWRNDTTGRVANLMKEKRALELLDELDYL